MNYCFIFSLNIIVSYSSRIYKKKILISMERDKAASNNTTQFDHKYDPEQDDQHVP